MFNKTNIRHIIHKEVALKGFSIIIAKYLTASMCCDVLPLLQQFTQPTSEVWDCVAIHYL